MFKVPGSRAIYEDTHKVARFRRILEPEGKRTQRLVQFTAIHGGMRTIAIDDIAEVK